LTEDHKLVLHTSRVIDSYLAGQRSALIHANKTDQYSTRREVPWEANKVLNDARIDIDFPVRVGPGIVNAL